MQRFTGVLITLLVSTAFGAVPALADPEQGLVHQARLGILKHDPALWSKHSKEDGVDLNLDAVLDYDVVDLIGGTIRPYAGASLSLSGDTSRLHAGLVWQYTAGPLFLDLGLGAAVHNGRLEHPGPDRKALGSRVLFHIPVEVGFVISDHHRIGAYFEHSSNANLVQPNTGIDAIGLRYTYQF
jgi:lipid A 3-O-deacylase